MNAKEREWCDAITAMGCIVCLLFYAAPGTPGAVHHMLTKGGRRIGHLSTLCLCDPGHHQYPPPRSGKISRHPNKRRFEAAYGTEQSLLEQSRELVRRRAAQLALSPTYSRPQP